MCAYMARGAALPVQPGTAGLLGSTARLAAVLAGLADRGHDREAAARTDAHKS